MKDYTYHTFYAGDVEIEIAIEFDKYGDLVDYTVNEFNKGELGITDDQFYVKNTKGEFIPAKEYYANLAWHDYMETSGEYIRMPRPVMVMPLKAGEA